jgi:hypothetical protein
MGLIAESAALYHDFDFDDDDAPSLTLDYAYPSGLTLLDLDQERLDMLRGHLLPLCLVSSHLLR